VAIAVLLFAKGGWDTLPGFDFPLKERGAERIGIS
jgi:hypothetical protein